MQDVTCWLPKPTVRCAQKTAAHLSHHAVVAAAADVNRLTCSRRRLAPDVSFTFLAAASHLIFPSLASKLTKSCTDARWLELAEILPPKTARQSASAPLLKSLSAQPTTLAYKRFRYEECAQCEIRLISLRF